MLSLQFLLFKVSKYIICCYIFKSHGEVCPAGWKPGDRTIIPNPAEKLKYFSKVQD